MIPQAFPWLLGLTLLLVLITALPLSKNEAWWVRGWDFPRLQIALLALGQIAASLLLLDLSIWQVWLLPAAGLACLAYQAWWIAPYTPLAPTQVEWAPRSDPDRTLAILTANVYTPNRDAGRLLELVEVWDPDLVITLESDAWWESQLSPLETERPHTVKCPLDNLYGMHLYSRYPLSEARIEFLVERDVPSIHALVHLPSGDRVRAHFLHPAPPSPTENEESAERDAELLVVGRSVAESEQPLVVTGDLNDVAWSRTTRLFRKISGLLDPRIGRGMFNTFHARYWFARWPLDHIFHSRHFLVARIERLGAFGSDHFPLYSRLVLHPARSQKKSDLEPNGNDLKEVHRKTSQKDVGPSDVPEPGEEGPGWLGVYSSPEKIDRVAGGLQLPMTGWPGVCSSAETSR